VSALDERIEAGWRELLAAVDGIPDDRLAEPGAADHWSVKDVLAHIAYWEDRLVERVERKLAGLPEPQGGDFEADNQREHEARRDWALERVWDDLRRGHERLRATVHAAPQLTDDDVAEETWEHYDEHVRAIRAWRGQAGV
jgi:uncharacterized protein (TIGR03083 family)